MKYITIIFFVVILSRMETSAQTYCGLTYTYDAGGNRTQRTISGDCGHIGEMLVITDTTSKDSVIQGLKETLFPNPTTGPISVVFNNPVSEAKITITDNLGRQLYSTTASGSSIPIDMSNFAEGIYYIVVRTQGNKYQSSVVKE